MSGGMSIRPLPMVNLDEEDEGVRRPSRSEVLHKMGNMAVPDNSEHIENLHNDQPKDKPEPKAKPLESLSKMYEEEDKKKVIPRTPGIGGY